MAIYHLSAKVVQRSRGQSSVVAAARRSGLCLFDERVGLTQRPLSIDRPIYSEIILPHAAPAKWLDRETLWNAVEASGLRRDSLVAREIEVSLPVELPIHLSIELAKSYAVAAFVNIGMVVDLNVWIKHSANSGNYPWASLLLTTRHVLDGRFGLKVPQWNGRKQLAIWRSEWAAFANAALRAGGFVADLDHRSFADRGIEREPQNKIGPAEAIDASLGRQRRAFEAAIVENDGLVADVRQQQLANQHLRILAAAGSVDHVRPNSPSPGS